MHTYLFMWESKTIAKKFSTHDNGMIYYNVKFIYISKHFWVKTKVEISSTALCVLFLWIFLIFCTLCFKHKLSCVIYVWVDKINSDLEKIKSPQDTAAWKVPTLFFFGRLLLPFHITINMHLIFISFPLFHAILCSSYWN